VTRFHPAIQRVKAILDSGELGAVKSITATLVVPNVMKETNIRFDYDLGGGALMDMGCENISSTVFHRIAEARSCRLHYELYPLSVVV
jgi:predicted dehydrogenase